MQRGAGAGFERPELTYESSSASALDLEGVTITLRYRLQNPNGFALDLRRVAYELEVEGRRVAAGELPSGGRIAASGSTPIAFPVRLRWRDIPDFAEVLGSRREVAYRITGETGVGSPAGTIGLPFDREGRVALPRLPSLSLESIALKDTSPSSVALEVRLRVENGNAFRLPAGALAYGIRVGERDIVVGGRHPLAALPPGGRATISLPVQLSFAGAAETVRQLMHGAVVRLRGRAGYGAIQVPVDAGGQVERGGR